MSNSLDQHIDAYQETFLYSLDNRLILNWYPERVMNLSHGPSLLELGLGHGFSTARFARHFSRHVVIDGSPEIIEQFKANFPDCPAEIHEGYFENFQTDERFDNIVMGFILEHVDDPRQILLYFKQFLKPGGSLFITVPNAEALNKRLGYEAGLLKDLFALSDSDRALGHQQLFSVERLRALIHETGFTEVTMEGLLLKPITTQQILDLQMPESVLQAMLKVGVDFPELSVGLLMEVRVESP